MPLEMSLSEVEHDWQGSAYVLLLPTDRGQWELVRDLVDTGHPLREWNVSVLEGLLLFLDSTELAKELMDYGTPAK